MEEDIFSATDAAIKKACGSKDPQIVADSNGILVAEPLTGSFIGMSMRFSYLGSVACNIRLDAVWRLFVLWHELAHVFRKHVDDPSFNFHHDKEIFSLPVDSRTIPRQEKEANLISAEYCIDTNHVLELIGYNTQTMQDYRKLKKYQEKLSHAYNALRFSTEASHPTNSIMYRLAEYRRLLGELEEKRLDLESDIASMNCVKSLPEVAGELGTNETILKYKLEAMRIRGLDIDTQELEQYNKVFLGVI